MRKRRNKNNSIKISESLRELNPKFKEHRSSIESLRLRTQLLDLKAVLLVGAYAIFQALMYGQVTPSSAPAQQSLLFPACLSASASLAFWPAFIETVSDCMRTRRQQESSFMEQDKVFRKICSVRAGRNDGGAAAASQRSLDRAFASLRRKRRAYAWALYLTLLLFTLCVPLVYLSISTSRDMISGTVFHQIQNWNKLQSSFGGTAQKRK